MSEQHSGLIVLADWRNADATKRREMTAQKYSPMLYSPPKGETVPSDLVRIECSIHSVARALATGEINAATASAILKTIHNDMGDAVTAVYKLDRKLRKAKKRVKR
jgi:hypothetical protein